MIEPDEETREWFDRVAEELPPLIRKSAVTLQIAADEPDAKMAVELGYSLLMDKPLIIVVPAGRSVPTRLARAADAIIEWSDEPGLMAQQVRDAMDDVLAGEPS